MDGIALFPLVNLLIVNFVHQYVQAQLWLEFYVLQSSEGFTPLKNIRKILRSLVYIS